MWKLSYSFSNSATETVKQELLFVGQESGKLIAIRDIIGKVNLPNHVTDHVTGHVTAHVTDHVTDHVMIM